MLQFGSDPSPGARSDSLRVRHPLPQGERASEIVAPPCDKLAKEQVSLRIDRDVLDFFQADGPGWRKQINTALRQISCRRKRT